MKDPKLLLFVMGIRSLSTSSFQQFQQEYGDRGNRIWFYSRYHYSKIPRTGVLKGDHVYMPATGSNTQVWVGSPGRLYGKSTANSEEALISMLIKHISL